MRGVEVPRDRGAIYAVHVHYFGGGEDGQTFANDAAFSRANEAFEQACGDPDVLEAWLTRADDPNGPKYVARRGRRAFGGPMEDLAFAEEMLPDPTDAEEQG